MKVGTRLRCFIGRSGFADVPLSLLVMWALAKALGHFGLCTMSRIRPILEREELIAIWPPGRPVAVWLERVLLAPLERWDVEYYIRIATTGYRVDDGTLQFHPLYPVLARPYVLAGFGPLLALSIISAAAVLLLMIVLHRYIRVRMEPTDAQYGTLCFILSPFAFALLVPYTEALFLFFAVLCLYWARERRWWLAGVSGVLATLTRQQGLLLTLPLLWLAFEQGRGSEHGEIGDRAVRFSFSTGWLAILGGPLAYVGWIIYRGVAFGDLEVNTRSIHSLIYSVFVSPAASQVVPVQAFLWPWDAVGRAVTKLVMAPDVDIVANLIGGAWFLVLMFRAWRYLDPSERVYTAAIVLVSFAYYTGPVHPYMGLLRHLLLAFPVLVAVPLYVRSRLARVTYLATGYIGQLTLLLLYGLHVWVP